MMFKTKHISPLTLTFTILTIALVGIFLHLAPFGKAFADEDTTAPELISFSFDKVNVNTEEGSDTLTLTMELSDDLTGVDVVEVDEGVFVTQTTQVSVIPVSGGSQSGVFIGFDMTSGTSMSGTFEATITLPQGSAIGEWRVDGVMLYDQIGNIIVYGYDELLSHPAIENTSDLSFTNTATTEDVTGPVMTEVLFSTNTIDTSLEDVNITATVSVTDNLSGVSDGIGITMKPASGPQQWVHFSSFELAEGDPTNGIYTSTATFPRYSASGTWVIDVISLEDILGNMSSYLDGNFEGIVGNLEITNEAEVEDIEAPEVTYFRISPSEFDTSEGDVELTLELGLEDNLTGIGYDTQVGISPLIGTQSYNIHGLELDESHELDNIYTATVTLPQYSKQGLWVVDQINLYDGIGNSGSIFSNQFSDQLPDAEGLVLINKALTTEVEIERDWILSSELVTVKFDEGTVITRGDDGLFGLHRLLSQSYNIEELDGFQGFIDSALSDNTEKLEECEEVEGCVGSDLNDDNLTGNPVYALRMGIPGLNLSFSAPVTITLKMPSGMLGQTLLIQTFQEGGDGWYDQDTCTVEMYDPNVGMGEGMGEPMESYPVCVFTTDHATFFVANVLGVTAEDNAGVPNTGLGGSQRNWLMNRIQWLYDLVTN